MINEKEINYLWKRFEVYREVIRFFLDDPELSNNFITMRKINSFLIRSDELDNMRDLANIQYELDRTVGFISMFAKQKDPNFVYDCKKVNDRINIMLSITQHIKDTIRDEFDVEIGFAE